MMVTVSDKSDEVCERIVKAGLHEDILKILSWKTLSAATLNNPCSRTEIELVEQEISILHNVVRRTESARGAFRKCQAVDVVQKFRNVTKQPVVTFCFLLVTLDEVV